MQSKFSQYEPSQSFNYWSRAKSNCRISVKLLYLDSPGHSPCIYHVICFGVCHCPGKPDCVLLVNVFGNNNKSNRGLRSGFEGATLKANETDGPRWSNVVWLYFPIDIFLLWFFFIFSINSMLQCMLTERKRQQGILGKVWGDVGSTDAWTHLPPPAGLAPLQESVGFILSEHHMFKKWFWRWAFSSHLLYHLLSEYNK